MTSPAWGDIVPLTDTWETLPDVSIPYYVVADEGTFLHRRTAIGRGLVRTYKKPTKLAKVGHYKGAFTYDAEPLPAHIFAQAVSFFRRIRANHHSEAEVLITQHHETKTYRLFVPTQRVSGGGVHSIYDPTNIAPGYLVVGTMHSHPGSAFHSSTDEGDARDMDGVHHTIGYLERPMPEVASMVALNGTFFHFSDPADIIDMSNLAADTAPPWWDRYVLTGTVTDADRPTIAPYAGDEPWEKFMGRWRRPQPVQPPKPAYHAPRQKPRTLDDDDAFIELMRENGFIYNPETGAYRPATFNNERHHNIPLLGPGNFDEDYWEDNLGHDYVTELFETGLFTDEDLTLAIDSYPDSGTRAYWEKQFTRKLLTAADWLRDQGLQVSVDVQAPHRPIDPNQLNLDEVI